MNIPWETIVIVALVGLAGAYLVYKIVRIVCLTGRKGGTCCGDCPVLPKRGKK